jgi:UDP-N-acetylmuramoyl-tripeptide--D-alanyl-D-alanine ligase
MIPLPLAEVARITAGTLVDGAAPEATVTGDVVIDSRRVSPGGLFVCVRGEHVDGHDYAAQALAAGAVGVVADRATQTPAVLVDDTQAALGAMAHGVIGQSSARVVGVTGSTGKTSTKDLLAVIFAAEGETVAAEGSFNNEFGLPLTALRVTPSTRTLVLEYSARGVGHIRYLCGIARPTVAVVLNVGAAHLGEFGSREAIAQAKGELVEALPPDGVAVLNADDELVAAMARRTDARVITFGVGPTADVRLGEIETDELARPSFRLTTPHGAVDVRLRVHGRHQAGNAAAATAAALAAGLPLDRATAALEAATTLSPHRMQLRERPDGVVVIDDAYNANPESMRAALTALVAIAAGRRSWALLGPMRELGADSAAMHEDVGRAAAELGVDELVVVGADAAPIIDGARGVDGWTGRTRTAADADAAAAIVTAAVAPGDVVLVKASNSERLWRVADALMDNTVVEVRA